MKAEKNILKALAFLVLLFSGCRAVGCSMYKITKNGSTMVGSNYDAYYLTPRIWFEIAESPSQYGAAFSGARLDGSNGFAPQSGMNEAGLSFSRAAVVPKVLEVQPSKKQITNPTVYMKAIMHACKTVDEVKAYISQYDHGYFNGDVFLYTDKTGRYLVVEPDTMYFGAEAKYVLSNFCPSTTNLADALTIGKYRKGMAFRNGQTDSSLAFCTALSDTMHICREKIGDGTLLTNINDLTTGTLYYYFYHDYQHPIKFNLKAELAKGNHRYKVPELFPKNAEFENLINYKTPQNNSSLMVFLFGCAGFFLFSALFYLLHFFLKRKTGRFGYLKLFLLILGLLLSFYMLVLLRNESIFYFPAPYKFSETSPFNFLGYIPVLLLLAFLPLLLVNVKILKEKAWGIFPKWLFTFNNLAFLALIVLFGYWGLFNIF